MSYPNPPPFMNNPSDHYMPEHGDRWRPPADFNRNPPLSPRSARTSDMYQFRGRDSYRPDTREPDRYRPPGGNRYGDRFNDGSSARDGRHGEFSFRAGPNDGRFPPQNQSSLPPQKTGRRPITRSEYARRGRGGMFRQAISERPLLRSTRESTPEQLHGMNEGTSRFIDLDDVSLSDEAEMDLEDEDQEAALDNEGDGAPRTQKPRVDLDHTADASAVPKWSNPDPYTSLPPPDETQTKKKDVVKLIRKAKVVSQTPGTQQTVVADNADFISFNFDEDLSELSESVSSGSKHGDGRTQGHPVSLRQDDRIENPPGALVKPLNSTSLGPPPARSQNGVDNSRIMPSGEVTNSQGLSSKNGNQGTAKLPPLPPSESNNGNRKRKDRESDDDLPPPPPKSRKRKKNGNDLDGSVQDDWLPLSQETCTPWCTIDHCRTENVGFWLHKEICDFYEFVKPHSFEQALRMHIVQRVEHIARRRFPKCRVHSFGSFAAGLYLPIADMDLVVISDGYRRGGMSQLGSAKMMRVIAEDLKKAEVAQRDSVEVITKAKVPIIKFVDHLTGIKVDLSFENMTGVIANDTFREWKDKYPAMPIIVTIIKQFLLMRGLNEVFTGGLGGFSVTCLVVSLLQHMPAIQSGNMNQSRHMGEILLNFFDLYGNKFNLHNTGISMRPPGYFPKSKNIERLSILDPNKHGNDISKGSSKVALVFRSFSEAHAQLRRRMVELHNADFPARRGASILSAVLAGNYSSFAWQRNRLKRIFAEREQSNLVNPVRDQN